MYLELPNVPTWLLICAAVGIVVLAGVGLWLLTIASRHRRERREELARAIAAGQTPAPPAEEQKERRTRRLVNTAAVICILLYLGLFASSFQAIAGFARSFLQRTGLQVPATPLTLDGVVVGALFLSLAFIAKRKSPAKANTLIWGMTIFAAYCGFTYGDSGSHGTIAAGLYYAVMSIVGMFMFHMVLELFQEDGDHVRSKYPSMGWRWITHWSTLPVMLAWINHPPRNRTSEQRPTVREAIDHWAHLKTVRARAKAIDAARRHEQSLAAARRKGELAAARRTAELAATPAPPALAAAPVSPAPAMSSQRPTRPSVVAFDGGRGAGAISASIPAQPEPATRTEVKVPATADACATWMDQWVKLIEAVPRFAQGQVGIKQDEAQAAIGASDRQARFVREAARNGALRAKAADLGVPVPDGYVDRPEDVWHAAVAREAYAVSQQAAS